MGGMFTGRKEGTDGCAAEWGLDARLALCRAWLYSRTITYVGRQRYWTLLEA